MRGVRGVGGAGRMVMGNESEAEVEVGGEWRGVLVRFHVNYRMDMKYFPEECTVFTVRDKLGRKFLEKKVVMNHDRPTYFYETRLITDHSTMMDHNLELVEEVIIQIMKFGEEIVIIS